MRIYNFYINNIFQIEYDYLHVVKIFLQSKTLCKILVWTNKKFFFKDDHHASQNFVITSKLH